MKAKIFIITILVMILSAVEGYAQRGERGGGGRSSTTRVERRSSTVSRSPAPRTRSYATPSRTTRSTVSRPITTNRSSVRSSTPQRRETVSGTRTTNRSTVSRPTTANRSSVRSSTPQRRETVSGTRTTNRTTVSRPTTTNRSSVRSSNSSGWSYERVSGMPSSRVAQRDVRRGESRTGVASRHAPAPSRHVGPAPRRHLPPPPPPHRPWRPVFHHHHSYMHHLYHCVFDRWYWYTWGGYHNRFICHSLYRNRFFDNLLGYYIWGALDAPTRLDIGDMILTRYNSTLKVQIGASVSYLDLYRYQTATYRSGYTYIEVSTGNGSALVRFYDEYGNEATYRL